MAPTPDPKLPPRGLNATLEHAASCATWWLRYYYGLLGLHFVLGIAGILVGALIAAGTSIGVSTKVIPWLGVASTMIVGIVSFIQPGRMANVFYDSYWRIQLAILGTGDRSEAQTKLLTALEEGYTHVATIQPEAIQRDRVPEEDAELDALSDEEMAKLAKRLEAAQARRSAAKEAQEAQDQTS